MVEGGLLVVATSKKKIALVFSGAVSLGSFEAGVACEIVKYIQTNDDPGFEVDVIVGSSAGALTGALMAIALVYGLDPAIIEEAWRSVKLDDLLRLEKGDKSILSSSRVEKLIARYVAKPSGPRKLLQTGKAIRLAVVVTNLDGIHYEIHRSRGEEFAVSAIGYEDAMRFTLTPEFADWEKLRSAVRASSAFPAAFEHKTITRTHRELRKKTKYRFPTAEPTAFHYSDGGIVNNQPLNKAIEVVNELPVPDSGNGSQRVFLVVDPAPPKGGIKKNDYGVFDVVSKAVWTIPRNQTLYKDLLLLEKVNQRLHWKNSFVSAMADIWDAGGISADKAQALDRLCRDVAGFKGQAMMGIEPAEYLRMEEERITNAYRPEIQKVNNPDPFIKYCFLLEHVADLRNKHEISVEMISPQNPEQELAGVIFGNFGGFLDAGFMKHDFNVGRTYAERWLKSEISLDRLIQLGQQGISPQTKRKVLQGLLDNSLPILIEDIGPRLFAGKGDFPADVWGGLTFVKMFLVSLTKYIIKKSVSWTRGKILR
ncbi:MAG: patatin-like phospholipase family protein [Thermincola sp.]|jgi:predicted acylesterase/phospholipase RssA|nr:patatin-like phospholipase family protein [Thermincola sp.]